MQNFAGARAKLATATQDLFRLSGSHSIPVEAAKLSEPPAPSVPEPVSSARKPEASMMFSLEALMKANQAAPEPGDVLDEASNQLWSMQAATPLFGTSHDQALLTTPLKMEPAQSMDSMTLPSQTPSGRRWWPIVLAAGAGLALAGAGIYVFGSAQEAGAASTALPSAEHALVAQLPAPAPSTGPAPGSGPSAAVDPGLAPPAAQPADVAAPGADAPSAAVTGDPAAADPAAVVPAAPAPEGTPSETSGSPAKSPSAAVSSSKASGKDKPEGKKPAPRAVPAPAKAAAAAFDKGAAKTALNAAASAAASCGAGGAPAKGKIQVTFAPNGKVSDAQLVEGPFAGTTAGKCALRHFRSVKVPAFSGAAITVAKSFKVD